jgi:hypothetical protein
MAVESQQVRERSLRLLVEGVASKALHHVGRAEITPEKAAHPDFLNP